FQAEDGIRYLIVTGVQTCALPIWPFARSRVRHIPSAPSSRARRYGQGHRLRCVECLPLDRSPQDRDVRVKICEVQLASHPTRFRSEERRVGKEGRCVWAAEHAISK